jgi:hypothetical protein
MSEKHLILSLTQGRQNIAVLFFAGKLFILADFPKFLRIYH